VRSQEEILGELEELTEQDSNDREIDSLREIVSELLDDREALKKEIGNMRDLVEKAAEIIDQANR
jgi:hypothetical protein